MRTTFALLWLLCSTSIALPSHAFQDPEHTLNELQARLKEIDVQLSAIEFVLANPKSSPDARASASGRQTVLLEERTSLKKAVALGEKVRATPHVLHAAPNAANASGADTTRQ